MNIPTICPCCSSKLIRHIEGDRDYWFCRTCWSEMPVIDSEDKQQEDAQKSLNATKNVWDFSRSLNT